MPCGSHTLFTVLFLFCLVLRSSSVPRATEPHLKQVLEYRLTWSVCGVASFLHSVKRARSWFKQVCEHRRTCLSLVSLLVLLWTQGPVHTEPCMHTCQVCFFFFAHLVIKQLDETLNCSIDFRLKLQSSSLCKGSSYFSFFFFLFLAFLLFHSCILIVTLTNKTP